MKQHFLLFAMFLLFGQGRSQVLDAPAATMLDASLGISRMGRKDIFPSDGSTCLGQTYNGGTSYTATIGLHHYLKCESNKVARLGFGLRGSFLGFRYANKFAIESIGQDCSGSAFSEVEIKEQKRVNTFAVLGPVLGFNTRSGLLSIGGYLGYAWAIEPGYTFDATVQSNGSHHIIHREHSLEKGGLCSMLGIQYLLLINQSKRAFLKLGAAYIMTSSQYNFKEDNFAGGPLEVKLYGFQASAGVGFRI